MAASEPSPVADGDFDRALALCHRELGLRDRTVAQMRRCLQRSGTRAATIEAALAWLIERRFLDDASYAERFACDRRQLDGWGCERIRRRLEAVGVGQETIEATLAGRDGEEELAAALAVLHARLKGASGEDRDRRRALGLLLRRGYEVELAEQAVERHLGRSGD